LNEGATHEVRKEEDDNDSDEHCDGAFNDVKLSLR
jgi:hypothetical protein